MKAADADLPARAALRDLIWRVEHMRNMLLDDAQAVDAQTVRDLLDTSEARRAVGLPAEEAKAGVSFWNPGGGDACAEE